MFYIIINPTSGQGRARRIQHLIFDELEKRSIAYKTLAAEEAGQIPNLGAPGGSGRRSGAGLRGRGWDAVRSGQWFGQHFGHAALFGALRNGQRFCPGHGPARRSDSRISIAAG